MLFQNAVVVTLASFAMLLLAYFTYGRFMARWIFQLDSKRRTPAHELEDGVDYIPTKVPVLFGHHFASIAGLGPILGPAVAVVWGWLPAVLWVVFGCILVGAVHDLGALTVSLRFKGRSIGDVCRELIGPRARLLFLLIIFFLMSLAMGAFVNAISALFVNFRPDAIIPSFGLMIVAMAMGIAVYKFKVGLGPATVVGLAAFAGLIYLGVQQPVPSYEWFAGSQAQQAISAGREVRQTVWETEFLPYPPASPAPAPAPQDAGDEPEPPAAASSGPIVPLANHTDHKVGFVVDATTDMVHVFVLDKQDQRFAVEADQAFVELKKDGKTTRFELAAFEPKKGRSERFDAVDNSLYRALEGTSEFRIQVPVTEPRIEDPYGSADTVRYLTLTGQEPLAKEVGEAAASARFWWIIALLGYGFIASVLPVWLLLQPRDYINSYQLYIALALLTVGLIAAASVSSPIARIAAPPIRLDVGDGADSLFPFLFVTIACGAVSGFHSLVSSGTTVRQIDKETDALPIGFGAMLTEGALAILVIMACVAGLGSSAWGPGGAYFSFGGIKGGGLGTQLDAVVDGGANFLAEVSIPLHFGAAFLAVTIVAFAMTTLDSATRLLRFNVEEIFRSVGLTPLANRYVASAVAVAGIAMFGLLPAGTTLWVMFGTTNQLLAGLTLLAVGLFLYKSRGSLMRTVVGMLLVCVPMVGMLTMTVFAMVIKMGDFWDGIQNEEYKMLLFQVGKTVITEQHLLLAVSGIVLAMTAWLIVEGLLAFAKGRGTLNLDDGPVSETEEKAEKMAATTHLG